MQEVVRKVQHYTATILNITEEDGVFTVTEGASVDYLSSRASDVKARAAFRAANVRCPRGSKFKHEPGDAVMYVMSLEDFIKHASVADS